MSKPPKTARTRRDARRGRLRERTTVFAAGMSALATLLSAFAVFGVLASVPGTALRNFCLLVVVNGNVSPGSDLYRSLFAQIERQEVFVSAACLTVGGLVLGRLVPRRIPRPRLLRAAGLVAVGVVVACILFRWGLILWGQGGHLRAGELNTQVEIVQSACSAGWVLAYLIGTWIGVRWRDAAHRAGAEQPEPSSLSLSR